MKRLAVKSMLIVAILSLGAGCQSDMGPKDAGHVVLFVPGASGDGPWYDNVKRGIVEHCGDARVQTVTWGAPMPLFAFNFSNKSIHDSAEEKLAKVIEQQPGPVVIVAHSAGSGVTLGALARLDDDQHVANVILLAPSVSPTYDLAPAVKRISGTIHAFYSDRDTLFLSWRTSNFGTYDNIKTRAAGNVGFDLARLTPEQSCRVVQHPYDPSWESLGNDGSHDGMLARGSVDAIIMPLLSAEWTCAAPASPSAEIDR